MVQLRQAALTRKYFYKDLPTTMNRSPFPATKSRQWNYKSLFLWLGYWALAIALTWPTVAHFSTHLPGDGGDDPALAWNLWWVKYALLNAPQNPLETDFIFYPVGINLAFYTLTLLNTVTAIPLTLNFGVVAAGNLHMWFTFVVGAYGTFLLTRYALTEIFKNKNTTGRLFSKSRGLLWISAAIAGGFYAFAGSKLFYVALGQFNIASTHWIPFTVLYVLRTRHRPNRLKNPLMAALFLTMQAWTEMTYASFLLIFIGLYWLYWLLAKFKEPTTRRQLAASLQAIVITGATFLIGISPLLAQMLPDLRTEGDFLVEGSGFAGSFSADLLGFVVPTMHHPWWGNLVTYTNIVNFSLGQHIYIGFVLLGLTTVGLITGYRYPAIRFWLLMALVFSLLTLGPVITINGYSTGLPGPFVLLQNLPFFKGNRYPSRYSVMLLLSLSVLAGFGLFQILYWLKHRFKTHPASLTIHHAMAALIFLLFLIEHLSLPLPQSDMRLPAPYRLIAGTPGDFTVLDIPFAWRNGFRITGPLTTRFMFGQFYQTGHQKKLIQGNTSRNPDFKFQYFTNAPVINSLLALETGRSLSPEQAAADQTLAAEVLRFFNIRYIVIRPYRYEPPPDQMIVTEQAVQAYIEENFPVVKIHNGAAIDLYRVEDLPLLEVKLRPNLLIKSSNPLAPLYFGEGWGRLSPGRPLTAQRSAARLLLPLAPGHQRLTLTIRLPEAYQDSDQSLFLELNGWQSAPKTIDHSRQEIDFDLPAEGIKPGLNELWLHFDRPASLPRPARSKAVLDITALSAGEEVGDFGYIYVNGHNISPNRRGYNVALIQPTGEILAVANFDTHLDPPASAALVDFLAAAPAEAYIAVAAADEAGANLTEEAVLALQALGATGDLRGCFRCSHAFIRPPAGPIVEELSQLKPVGVTTNLGLTEPTIAAIIDTIQVQPVEK